MPYREVRVMDVHEVVRRWSPGDSSLCLTRRRNGPGLEKAP
jgi:hypothetical protein